MILDRFRLDGRVAIVTGAGKGIGRGIAIGFAEAGADVVCAARTAADLDDVAAEIAALGRRALAVPTDVMQTGDLDHLVDATVEHFGRLDVLVNNAGGTMPRAGDGDERALLRDRAAVQRHCRVPADASAPRVRWSTPPARARS